MKTNLTALTGAEADIGQVADEMAVLVPRSGDHPRASSGPAPRYRPREIKR